MSEAPRKKRSLLAPRGFVLMLVVGGLLFSSVYPLRSYLNVRSDIDALEAEERALQDRIDELSAQRDRLLSDAEVEQRARAELGMVRPGEIPFVIATPKAEPPAPTTADPRGFGSPAEPDDPSSLERWWEAFRRAIGA